MIQIAVCDDEPVICRLLKEKIASFMKISRESFALTCYTSSSELLNSAAVFDLIFLDIQMLTLLLVLRRIIGTMLLEQQIRVQESYLNEICSRYDKTCSFRHDVKNHLTVLQNLLNTGEFQEAGTYLSHLEQAAGTLSFPVHTGRRAVDALLESKLAIASEYSMKPQCELSLPGGNEVTDMDWCILLGNALDNAIHASRLIPPDRRMLKICGCLKGNLYLLTLENACSDTEERPLSEGTGLSNIRAVARKYGGKVRLASANGRFRLDILIVISSHSNAHSHQKD